MKTESLRRRLENLVFASRRKRWHGQRSLPRCTENVVGVVAGDSDLPLCLFVVGLEILIGDGPVVQRAAFHGAVGGAQVKILFYEAPCHGSVAEGTAADAGGVVAVGPVSGRNNVVMPGGINVNTRIAIVGTEGISQHAGALVAQVVFALIEGRELFATLEENDAQSSLGKFFGDDAASGAATYDHRVDMFQRHQLPLPSGAKALILFGAVTALAKAVPYPNCCARAPKPKLHWPLTGRKPTTRHQPDLGFGRSERTLPRIGGYGRFSIFQLTPSRLPPWRGSP